MSLAVVPDNARIALAPVAAPLHRNAAPRRPGVVFWVVFSLLVLAAGSLRFLYIYLGDVATGRTQMLLERLMEEGTGALGAALILPAVVLLELRWPVTRATWRRALLVHVVGLLVFSVAHTSLNWGSRVALSPLIGLGSYDYGRMTIRYFMELPNDAIIYAVVLTAMGLRRTWQALRDREVRAAELERALAQAQLRNLQLQLQPHFLFNALNTISERMYDDPAGADGMLGQLAELLRRSLHAPLAHEVSLSDEVAFLGYYIDIMRARFGEALRVDVEIAADAIAACVPSLLLQPLVENAVRHGIGPRGHGLIQVQARRADQWLEIIVADDGVGATDPQALHAGGLGLSTTRERLSLFYGDAQSFDAGSRPGGGFVVTLRVPFRTLDAIETAMLPAGAGAAP